MHDTPTPRCVARHSGLWAIEPRWLQTSLAAYRAGTYPLLAMADAEARSVPWHTVTEDGIGLLQIHGAMMKGASKFGNVDDTEVRRVLRAFTASANVLDVVVSMDTPGGTVDGTQSMAADMAALARTKRTVVQVEGECCSKGQWVASFASAIFAEPGDSAGSCGAWATIQDTSKAAEMAGVAVHVISSGEFKAAGADGSPITPEHIAYFQQSVDAAWGAFADALKRGRKMTAKQISEASSGRVYGATEAQALGLLDGVQRMDDTLAMIRKERKAAMSSRSRARAMASLRVDALRAR